MQTDAGYSWCLFSLLLLTTLLLDYKQRNHLTDRLSLFRSRQRACSCLCIDFDSPCMYLNGYKTFLYMDMKWCCTSKKDHKSMS